MTKREQQSNEEPEEIPEEIHRKASILSKALMDLPPKTHVDMVRERRVKYQAKPKRRASQDTEDE